MSEESAVEKQIVDNGELLASLTLYNYEGKVWAKIHIGNEPEEFLELPPHLAAQVPMAIRSIQQMAG